MSAKVAMIIGDYSNGWNDAIIVQGVATFKQEVCNRDRKTVMDAMTKHVTDFISGIEGNEVFCPTPNDAPCCDKFVAWAKDQAKEAAFACCPCCGKKITDERKAKHFGTTIF